MWLASIEMPGGVDWLGWQAESALRLLMAAMLGAMIGAEREHHGRSAGFRTQLLVSLGAALAMLVSLNFARVFAEGPAGPGVRVDPARIAYGVMGGIGFLGGGTIIRYGAGVRGLTTAASLWCTAAVGLACGFGMYLVAALAAGIVIVALMFLSRLDRYIPSRWSKSLVVSVPMSEQNNVERVRNLLLKRGAHIVNVDYRRNTEIGVETITFHVTMSHKARVADLTGLADEIPQARELSIQ